MLGVSARLVVTDNIGFCPHPQGVRPETKGFSHGLKKCPLDTFYTSVRTGAALSIPVRQKIKAIRMDGFYFLVNYGARNTNTMP